MKSNNAKIPLMFIFLIVSWTVFMAGLFGYQCWQMYVFTMEMARNDNSVNLNRDMDYRLWAAGHGSIYVPITARTLPNPYLAHITDRDITTPSGRKFTLLSPAHMTRQVNELSDHKHGSMSRIISLKPLRSENLPDPWEAESLRVFESGVKEVSSLEVIDNKPYVRLIRPMVIEQACLGCHGQQGYKRGDIYGGVSISVPWEPYSNPMSRNMFRSLWIFGLIWGVGIVGIWFAGRRIQIEFSDREKAQKELVESRSRLLEAQRMAKIGNWELDLLTNRLVWSDEIFKIFEIKKEDFQASYEAFLSAIHPEDREAVNTAYKQSLETRQSCEISHRLRMQDGRVKFVHEQCVTFYNLEGKPFRSVGTVQDITERKQAEEEIGRLNATLERRVQARTSELEFANKEMEAFTYSVSHDLRAPLRIIDGFSKFLKEDYAEKLDVEGHRIISVIRSNTQKMDRLITDLLSLSMLTRAELNYSRVDMRALVSTVYEEAALGEVRKKFMFIPGDLLTAWGDMSLIRQVWFNLISNAVKYSMKSEIKKIEVGSYEENSEQVYFVRDYGVGFDPKFKYKLFGIFQRLHKVEDFDGNGVGLVIVQRVILRHQGRVWAESKQGQGATFYFSIPIKGV